MPWTLERSLIMVSEILSQNLGSAISQTHDLLLLYASVFLFVVCMLSHSVMFDSF